MLSPSRLILWAVSHRRYGRRSKRVKPLEWVEFLLAHRDLDVNPADGDEHGRFRHLQAMIEVYSAVSRTLGADSPLHAVLRSVTRDRFLATIERDRSSARLLGSRGQTLLHDAAMAGEAELAAELIRVGADPDAREFEGHTPLYYASTGAVAASSLPPVRALTSPVVRRGGPRCIKPRVAATLR